MMIPIRIFSLFLFLAIFPLFTLCASMTLKDKLLRADEGEYIVTQQAKNYSLLFLRTLTPSSAILEEITVAQGQLAQLPSWKEWVKQGAPGHTSWVIYEIDLNSLKLKEGYSFSKRGWLYIDESEYFLVKLFHLPFIKTLEKDRKRIGPPPPSSEIDTRRLWNPPFVREGKKIENGKIEAWHAYWPSDHSDLSGAKIEFYFDAQHPAMPFPIWTEIQASHYTLKIRTIDCGSGMQSPKPSMPHRPLQFLGKPQRIEGFLRLLIQSPSYYERLNLFAIDLSSMSRESIPIPFLMQKAPQKELLFLDVSLKDLETVFLEGHLYQWIAIPENASDAYAEMSDVFLWEKEK